MEPPPSEDFGRQPPQDLAAEQAVLGGMLLSKDAIADVLELVRGVDYYRPAHELIHDAILDLFGRGEPADAITVADTGNSTVLYNLPRDIDALDEAVPSRRGLGKRLKGLFS